MAGLVCWLVCCMVGWLVFVVCLLGWLGVGWLVGCLCGCVCSCVCACVCACLWLSVLYFVVGGDVWLCWRRCWALACVARVSVLLSVCLVGVGWLAGWLNVRVSVGSVECVCVCVCVCACVCFVWRGYMCVHVCVRLVVCMALCLCVWHCAVLCVNA